MASTQASMLRAIVYLSFAVVNAVQTSTDLPTVLVTATGSPTTFSTQYLPSFIAASTATLATSTPTSPPVEKTTNASQNTLSVPIIAIIAAGSAVILATIITITLLLCYRRGSHHNIRIHESMPPPPASFQSGAEKASPITPQKRSPPRLALKYRPTSTASSVTLSSFPATPRSPTIPKEALPPPPPIAKRSNRDGGTPSRSKSLHKKLPPNPRVGFDFGLNSPDAVLVKDRVEDASSNGKGTTEPLDYFSWPRVPFNDRRPSGATLTEN